MLIHQYGPHIFHTNSRRDLRLPVAFTEWRPYEHRVLASVDGQLRADADQPRHDQHALRPEPRRRVELRGVLRVDAPSRSTRSAPRRTWSSARSGRELYEKFFRGYTRKQWGLDPSRARRVGDRARADAHQPRRPLLHRHYQAMPLHGYTRMFERMLDHPNIKIMLNTDYREIADVIPYRRADLHRADRRVLRLPLRQAAVPLAARSSTRRCDSERFQPVAGRQLSERARLHAHHRVQVPDRPGAPQDDASSTSIPRAEGDPYYPVPRPENAALYKQYKALADGHAGRALRRPAGDLQVLQHGPGRRRRRSPSTPA